MSLSRSYSPPSPARGTGGVFSGGLLAPTVDVFIDYQNAHYCGHRLWCPKLEKMHHCLVDPLKLAELLVQRRAPGGVLQTVRVFRGRPNPRKDPVGAGRNDKQAYAWTDADARVKVFRNELQYLDGWDDPVVPIPPREKGVDVHLAIDLVERAIDKEYEVAIVFTHDTDLIPAIDLALRRKAHVEVGSWDGRNRLTSKVVKLWNHALYEEDFIAVRDTRTYH